MRPLFRRSSPNKISDGLMKALAIVETIDEEINGLLEAGRSLLEDKSGK